MGILSAGLSLGNSGPSEVLSIIFGLQILTWGSKHR